MNYIHKRAHNQTLMVLWLQLKFFFAFNFLAYNILCCASTTVLFRLLAKYNNIRNNISASFFENKEEIVVHFIVCFQVNNAIVSTTNLHDTLIIMIRFNETCSIAQQLQSDDG